MNEFLCGLAKTLSSFADDPAIYASILDQFLLETATDFALSRRITGSGALSVNRRIKNGQTENERSAELWAAASDDPVKRAAAMSSLEKSNWAIIRNSSLKKAGVPIFELILAKSSGEIANEAALRVECGLELISTLLAARLRIAEREAEHDRSLKELRSSEEEMRRFFEDSKDMIYTSNSEDRIASINQAGVALIGFSNRFDAIGRNFSDFVLNPEDRAYFLGRIREKGFIRDYEILIKRPGGEDPAFCLETAHAVMRPDGTVTAIQGIVKDISERIKSEKALWAANMQLTETNKRLNETQTTLVQQEKLASIGQLAAGVAHEINNPLGFMKSNFSTAKEYIRSLQDAWIEAKKHLDPEVSAAIEKKEDLGFIIEELPQIFMENEDGYARIISIVSQLKTFAHIDPEAKQTPYDIEKGIESSLIIAWNEIKYVADVKKEFTGISPVMAESGGINQVLLNVLVNAAQAIASQKRKDRGLITISTWEDNTFAYCSMSDDGPGMTEDVRKRVFDPFFTTKEPGKGTGLGLSISYDIIVNKHGGKFAVRSKPGSGATFEIGLPKKTLPPV